MSNWQQVQSALPLIDAHQVQQMEQQFGAEVVARLLSLFSQEGELQSSLLQQAVMAGKYEEVAQICHSLKAASGSYGALRCQYLSEKLEVACRQQQLESIEVLASAWLQAWDETLGIINGPASLIGK